MPGKVTVPSTLHRSSKKALETYKKVPANAEAEYTRIGGQARGTR